MERDGGRVVRETSGGWAAIPTLGIGGTEPTVRRREVEGGGGVLDPPRECTLSFCEETPMYSFMCFIVSYDRCDDPGAGGFFKPFFSLFAKIEPLHPGATQQRAHALGHAAVPDVGPAARGPASPEPAWRGCTN